MNHPKPEEWVPYLSGEVNSAERKRLSGHLRHCPECAAEITGWRRTIKQLDRWRLPRRRRARMRILRPVLRWAAAAAIVLGIGFGIGRLSAPPTTDATRLGAEIEKSVRASLGTEIRQQVVGEVAEFLMANLQEEMERHLTDIVHLFQQTYEKDRQATLALIGQIQQQHVKDYLLLRKDLETVASLTDQEMQQAHQRILQLALKTKNE